MRKLILLFLALTYCVTLSAERFNLDIETGAAWQHRNDVKINPTDGTYVQFDQFNQGPFLHQRLNLKIRLFEDHSLRLVYAPFNISVTGQAPYTVNFDGSNFTANENFEIHYQFNSYRIGYVYHFDKNFALGLTGKIRDAEIEFSQGTNKATYSNVGFVPLFYLSYQTQIGSNYRILTDIDFAAASQGRAIDFTAKLIRTMSDNLSLGIGYRTLEGGADNDKVFTYSWLNYALLDLIIHF